MLFNSFIFVGFLAVVLAGYWALRTPRYQNPFLLVASLFFYGFGGPWFLVLIVYCAAVAYAVGLLIERSPRHGRTALFVGVPAVLSVLFVFKYFNFFVDTVASNLPLIGVEFSELTLRLALPIGISFFTFQAVGYMIDVHRGDAPAERNPVDFFLFVTFFPQLVAGPIERATHLLPQIRRRRSFDESDLGVGVYLILQGYVKKVVIADNLKPVVDSLFGFDNLTAPLVAVGLLAFAFQIYGDFSGYTDIARGVARLMGFNLLLNFRRPYIAANPSEFWRRWHITLSNWFRDYVYIPLGGNRSGPGRVLANLMATMVLSGLWHGASTNFILWGAFHGVLLIAHRLWREARPEPSRSPLARGASIAVFFTLTVYGWMLFRITSWDTIVSYTRALFTDWSLGHLGLVSLFAVLPYVLLAVVVDVVESRALESRPAVARQRVRVAWGLAPYFAALLAIIVVLGSETGGEFIYFKF